MLAGAMRLYRIPLSASLWAEYGIDLEAPPFGAWRLAGFMEVLPPGCAFWRAVGGPRALSTTEQALRTVEFRLREVMHQAAGKKGGSPPEPQEPPPYAHEAVSEQVQISEAQRRYEKRFGK